MPKIDEIDNHMHLRLRRQEDRKISERLQEHKWKGKQLKY